MIVQINISLRPYSRGFHLITREILSQLPPLPDKGLLNLFIRHTSASLSINENYDPSVRVDLENIYNNLIPENRPSYTHIMEGSDDMPSHAKANLTGHSLTIPIQNGKPALGTWQGIYLCEFRNHGGNRHILATIYS